MWRAIARRCASSVLLLEHRRSKWSYPIEDLRLLTGWCRTLPVLAPLFAEELVRQRTQMRMPRTACFSLFFSQYACSHYIAASQRCQKAAAREPRSIISMRSRYLQKPRMRSSGAQAFAGTRGLLLSAMQLRSSRLVGG